MTAWHIVGCELCAVAQSIRYHTGPGRSKLTMSLVNVSIKIQTLISEKCHALQKLLTFFQRNYQCIWL